MKLSLSAKNQKDGFALILVLILVGISLLILTYDINRTETVAILNQRNNQFNVCCNVAEAAVEKAFARMAYDFQSYALAGVYNNLSIYQTNIPNENSYWTNFVFSDAQGNVGHTYVNLAYYYGGPLPSSYTGLFCTSNSPVYRIISNVQLAKASPHTADVVGVAQEDVLLALVPLNTWAIFYNGLLEFTTCATMTVNGRVQANGTPTSPGNIYVGSGSTLTFNAGVSCTGSLTSPADNGSSAYNSGNWNVVFNGTPPYTTNVASVTVSINTNGNNGAHFIIDPPPVGETPTSSVGVQRLYNEAQMVLIVTNSPYANPTVQLTIQNSVNGAVPGNDPSPSVLYYTNATPGILTTNLPFLTVSNTSYDQRETATNLLTQIDVGRFSTWAATSSVVQGKLPSSSGLYPTILYAADRRTFNANSLPSVRLINAAQLPANNGMGFSVATPNPLYVVGNYNVQTASSAANASAATTNTAYTVPAALFSDALTILSSSWNDANANASYSTRTPVTTTVNAAIVTGTVPSTGTDYYTFSGGVHNLPRLLENWSTSLKLYLNTSILRLWDSTMATNQFRDPAGFSLANNPYYNPPSRQFSFDPNFLNPNKVPPGIPLALVPIRFGWAVPAPGVTTFTPTHN